MNKNFYKYFILNDKQLETTQMSISRRMDKQMWYIHINNTIRQ